MIRITVSTDMAPLTGDVRRRDQAKREADVLAYILKQFGYRLDNIEIADSETAPGKITVTNTTFRKDFE